jgi:hypothetical protein
MFLSVLISNETLTTNLKENLRLISFNRTKLRALTKNLNNKKVARTQKKT